MPYFRMKTSQNFSYCNTEITKVPALISIKRSSSNIEESKESKPIVCLFFLGSPLESYHPLPMNRKILSDKTALNKVRSDAPLAKMKHPKTSKNNAVLTQKLDFVPEAIWIVDKSESEDNDSRLGVPKNETSSSLKCQEFFSSDDVEIFKCKKLKVVQGKQKI